MTGENAVTETSLIAATDAGMHALWNPSRFTGITDYETWEDALLEEEDITQRIQAGELVPINIGSDGAFQLLGAARSERHRAGCVFAGERGFRGGSGCGGVACDDTVSVSVMGRPSPLPFVRSLRGGP